MFLVRSFIIIMVSLNVTPLFTIIDDDQPLETLFLLLILKCSYLVVYLIFLNIRSLEISHYRAL